MDHAREIRVYGHFLIADVQLRPFELVWLAFIPLVLGAGCPPDVVEQEMGSSAPEFFLGAVAPAAPYNLRIANVVQNFRFEGVRKSRLAFFAHPHLLKVHGGQFGV